jgi:hypothetical protein
VCVSAHHPLAAKPADCLSIAFAVVAVDCSYVILAVGASRSRVSGKFLFVRGTLPCHEQVSSSLHNSDQARHVDTSRERGSVIPKILTPPASFIRLIIKGDI